MGRVVRGFGVGDEEEVFVDNRSARAWCDLRLRSGDSLSPGMNWGGVVIAVV